MSKDKMTPEEFWFLSFFFLLVVGAITVSVLVAQSYGIAQRHDVCHAQCAQTKLGKGVWVEAFDRCVCELD